MKMKNVLDQLRDIAENNDSEDVARAIKTADAYSFKDRLAETESASVYGEAEDTGFDADTDDDSEDMGIDASTDDTNDVETPDAPDFDSDTNDEGDGTEDAFDRIHDRVEDRGGVHGTDPWGIGDDEVSETPGDDDQYCAVCGNTGKRLDSEDEECPNCSDDDPASGSAIDRVQGRAQRSGEGGPLDRLRQRHDEKYASLEEEMGKVFQTPMERHSWIMNQLNSIAGQMSPEDSAMVKKLMKTAGEANVKGGNC